jgi:hypothetical protein
MVAADVALVMVSSSGSGGTDPGWAVSAFLAALNGALLLLQGFVEMGVKGGRGIIKRRSGSGSLAAAVAAARLW